jgi:PhoPQ-activated pathogenicity-related protein
MNITRYLSNPNFDKLAQMVDPYCKTWNDLFAFDMISLSIAYFDRYTTTKIFQLQGAGDEFFLPDSEVR